MSSPHISESPSQQLAAFAAALKFEDIPEPVVRRTEELFLDWIASAIAGGNARAVKTIARFCRSQGLPSGPSEVFAE